MPGLVSRNHNTSALSLAGRSPDPGYFAFFRFAAQYAFIRSACALRRAALWRFRFGAEATGATGVATPFGGLPRRFARALERFDGSVQLVTFCNQQCDDMVNRHSVLETKCSY